MSMCVNLPPVAGFPASVALFFLMEGRVFVYDEAPVNSTGVD